MESPEPTESTSSLVQELTDLPLRSSEKKVIFELPLRHRPTTLNDIAEEGEPEVVGDSSRESYRVEIQRKEGNPGEPDDDGTEDVSCKPGVDYPELFKAIVRGDVEVVKSQLERGADVEQVTNDGFSPLIMAIMEERIDIVKLLLESGASTHRRYGNMPPLIHAVMKSDHGLQSLQLLIDNGAVLNTISGPDQKNTLHWAASEGKVEAVNFLISKGMNIEAKCTKGRTPLDLAAEAGHADVAKILWAQGADIHATSDNGGTALTWAACKNNVEMLTFLLEKGAKIDHKDNNGHTALSLASHFGHNDVVKALVDAGADINTRSEKPKGCTPVMAAACSNSVDALETLLDHGANPMLCSTHGDTALDIALMERKEGAVNVLLKALGGDSYPKKSVALQLAMANGHVMIKAIMDTASLMYSYMEERALYDKFVWIDWVLKQGGDIIKPAAMAKMLHVAMEEHDLPMISALLNHGCDVDLYLASGHTCLSYAVGHRDLELTKILLEIGADPTKVIYDVEGHNYTPFDHAIIDLQDGTDTEVVDMLLASGRCRINKGRDPENTAFSFVLGKSKEWAPGVADRLATRMIDSVSNLYEDRDEIGCTLLHVAVHHQRLDFVDLLRTRGFDLEVTGDAGYTAFIQACQYSPKMVPRLLERGANLHAKYKSNAEALHAAAAEGNVGTLEYLIGKGMDIEQQTLKGYTPLACALTWGREDTAMYLLKHGASVSWYTLERRQTALHFAARHGLEAVVEELLKRDVNVNALDDKGWGPLHEACATGTRKIVAALLNAGADMELSLPNNDRPLHIALINENEELALLLLNRGASVHALASRNRSPLHIAADYNLPTAVLDLLSRGLTATIDHVDDSTWTPLCCCGHADIVEELLQYGADVHYADKDGWTPLHQAVHNGERDVALALIAFGARLEDRTTDDGLSVLERAEDLFAWGDLAKGRAVAPDVLVRAVERRERNKRERERKMRMDEEWRVLLSEEKVEKKEDEELEGLGGKFEIVEREV